MNILVAGLLAGVISVLITPCIIYYPIIGICALMFLFIFMFIYIIIIKLGLKHLEMCSVFFLAYIIIIIYGTLIWKDIVDLNKSMFIAFCGAAGIFCGILSGLVFCNRIKDKTSVKIVSMDVSARRILNVMVLICMIVTVVYFYAIGYVPIVKFIVGHGETSLDILRMQSYGVGSDRGGGYRFQGYLNLWFQILLPWLVVAILLDDIFKYGLVKRSTKMLFFASCLILISTGQKWPVFYFFFFLVTSSYYSKNYSSNIGFLGTLIAKGNLLIMFSIISLLILMNLAQGRSDGIGDSLLSLLSRIVGGDAINYVYTVEYFSRTGLLYGKSWLMDLYALLPGSQETFSIYLHRLFYGSGNTAPPTLPGSLYANFGFLGVLIGMYSLMILIQAVYFKFIKYNVDPLCLATYCFIVSRLIIMIHRDVVPTVAEILIILCFYYVLNKIIKYRMMIKGLRLPGV